MSEEENKKAVVELYAYGTMLVDKFHLMPEWGNQEAKQVNEKARFSLQNITDEQRTSMEDYIKHIRECCKKQNGFWKTLKYRYILWLY